MRRLALALCLVSVAACGKSGSTSPDSSVPAGDTYSLTWGPVTVPAGQENTQCIWVKLKNTGELKIHSLHNVLSPSSHHLIVYKDDMDMTEQTTPVPCQPFTGALNTTGMISPIAITQKKDDTITLPDGVAYTFAAGQMVKLEMHYINAMDTDQMAQATVTFTAADASTIHDEASLLFTGSPDINIPANAPFTLHEFFTVPSYLDLSQSHIFAITGHEHHLGTGVTVQVAPAKTGPMTMVYDPMPFSWTEPATVTFDQPFSVPVNGGFDFTCTWMNTTAAAVKFGESANDEMCFFWAYYYPSQGSRVCVHTNMAGGGNGIDACCPGDPTICSLIAQNF